jgi:hypothetical protein
MPLKIVPFSEHEEGRWVGKIGRYEVAITRRVGNRYWRGPDKEVVLETDTESYLYSVRGSHSGSAATLAGAMERSERDCRELHGPHVALGDVRYAMNDHQAAFEISAREREMTEAVEADRIAHSNGWEMAIDVLPDLREFAERQGLFPFQSHSPGPGR